MHCETILAITAGRNARSARLSINWIDGSSRNRTPSQTDALSFEFDLHHSPEKVWRALTDPVLIAEWLLPVAGLTLEPGAAFTFKTQPYPGWDGTVNCRILISDN